MEIQFDDGIKRARFPLLSWLTSRQAFWVLVAVGLACIFLSFATNSFATSNNIFNVARNFTFVAIIALGMTIVIITGGIDLSVGSVLCLCSMILAVVMHAGIASRSASPPRLERRC
jgi:ribose transport system permease protein